MRSLTSLINIKALNDVLLLLLVNFLGFSSVLPTFMIGTYKLGLVDVEVPDFNELLLVQTYTLYCYITFIICAVFSLSFLFLRDRMRFAFLAAPLVVPVIYGLAFLARYSG